MLRTKAQMRRRWVPTRDIGWLLVVFLMGAALLFSLLYWLTTGYLVHEVDERLEGEFAEFHALDHDRAVTVITALSTRDIADQRPYGVFDPDGVRLAGNVSRLPTKEQVKPYNYTEVVLNGSAVAKTAHYRGIVIPTTSGLRIVVGHSVDELLRFNHLLLKTLCAGVALTTFLALLSGTVLNYLSNRKIAAINESVREIMDGDLGCRLPIKGDGGHTDLDRLAGIVNKMLDEIERLVTEVKSVTVGAAHDLRTPMTALRAGLERASRRAQSVDDFALAIDEAISQTDMVLARFGALLRIAEIESGSRRQSFRTFDLCQTVRDVCELYEPLADAKGISLTTNAPTEGVTIQGDPDLLFGAVENLVDNALKFTPGGGSISVSTEIGIEIRDAALIVSDSGPGIPAHERQAVLKTFYRSRRDNTVPGHGLGLSLVAAVARVHSAQLEIDDAGPGCRVVLRF